MSAASSRATYLAVIDLDRRVAAPAGTFASAATFWVTRPSRCARWTARRSRNSSSRFPVHEAVDDLCKKAASLWAGREMLGIAAAAHAHVKAVNWANTIHTLCTK
jgi:hypothetical protein